MTFEFKIIQPSSMDQINDTPFPLKPIIPDSFMVVIGRGRGRGWGKGRGRGIQRKKKKKQELGEPVRFPGLI